MKDDHKAIYGKTQQAHRMAMQNMKTRLDQDKLSHSAQTDQTLESWKLQHQVDLQKKDERFRELKEKHAESARQTREDHAADKQKCIDACAATLKEVNEKYEKLIEKLELEKVAAISGAEEAFLKRELRLKMKVSELATRLERESEEAPLLKRQRME